ncbi:MAG: type IV pilus assembly protein PilM, partial [Actinomycetota bacterium]
MARSSIGLDVGSKAVRVAEVRYGGGKPILTRYGRALLPAGAVEHGEVQDPSAVASAITGLWKELGLKDRTVHVGVANRHCVVRVVELPVMSRDDLESAIRFQAQEHIPIALDEAVMDFEVLEQVKGPEGPFQRVLVVAAERAAIDPLLAALTAARLEPQSLELNAYPLVRCFNGRASASAHAIVDVGGDVTNVVIHHDGKIRFSRILPNFGGEDFTAAIAESLGVSRDEAEKLKRRISKKSDSPATAVTDRLLDRFVNEVRGSIEFFSVQTDTPPLEDIVLTGGGSLIAGLAERLSSAVGVPVNHGHPFDHVPVDR